MANPDRDNLYSTDNTNRSVYTRESNGTGWFVGIIVVLALLAIGYLVFSANTGPATDGADTTVTTGVEAPADPATAPAPMTEAPATETAPAAPMTEAPAPEAAPATEEAAPAAEAPATEEPAPAAPATEETVPAQ